MNFFNSNRDRSVADEKRTPFAVRGGGVETTRCYPIVRFKINSRERYLV